ncbi:MAG: peptidyl-alpha-hydroxyglycine alpha-amidating lyase family protein [Rickettsiales bacterium]
MTTIMGEGEFTYRVEMDWAKLPDDWTFLDAAAVAVDANDNVYVFNRGEHPMCVFDREGNFLRSWGEDIFTRAHGIEVGPDQTLYCTDDGDHTVRHCTLDGKVLMTLGVAGKPAPYMSGDPFHRCTHTAQSPEGDIYVSDGYGNSRVHKYSPDGKLLFSWGEPGTDEGQFNIAHNICCDADGWVYVADRENHRVQVFDGNGRYEAQWFNMHRPCGLCMGHGADPLFYVGELGPAMNVNKNVPNLGPRLSVMTREGETLVRLGDLHQGMGPHQFMAPHGLAVDSRGDIYVGEVSFTNMRNSGEEPPANITTLRKLVRVDGG